MHPRSARPLVALSVLLFSGSFGVASGFAQAPATSAEDASRFAAPAPPAPPSDDGLFPTPGSTRPAPPVPDNGELRAAGAEARRGRKSTSQGGRLGGERRRPSANPALLSAAADPVEIRIAFRRAETEAKRDPAFADLLRRADLAHDDEERRVWLRRYYIELFARVRQINRSPALATHLAVLSRAAEQRYAPKRRAGGYDELEAGRERAGRQR